MQEDHGEDTGRTSVIARHERELSEIRGMRSILIALVVMAAGSLVAGAATLIRTTERLDATERAIRAHELIASHPGTALVVGDMRSEVRALTVEVRQSGEAQRITTTGMEARITTRLDRLEQRMDSATARPPR